MAENPRYRYVGTRPPRPDGIDKVTGRARYGADHALPGMLHGHVLRSPHAHARIVRIDTTRARALDGVFAIATRENFPELPAVDLGHIVMPISPRVLSHNVMARANALYRGHAVAAVAAIDAHVAAHAAELIEVEYEPLPHALDIDTALAPGATAINEELCSPESGAHPNLNQHSVLKRGDVSIGFAQAEEIVERRYTTAAVHQAYIEPHSCVVSADESGRLDIWCSTQGGFLVRAYVALLLGLDAAQIRVTASEIGGGFGGKLVPYLEPIAAVLSRKCGRPVKLTMNRDDVFVATGPAPATRVTVKVGATRAGRITALSARLEYEAGAFPGGSMHEGQMNIFSCYDVEHLYTEGFEVLVNKPNVAPYRAPGLPQALVACEGVIDELAQRIGMDPIELRLRNAVGEGSRTLYGYRVGPIGLRAALQAAREHPHYRAPIADGGGRGVACAFYMGAGCQSSATLHLVETGKIAVLVGTPDIGGSRAAMAMMVAEVLDIAVGNIDVRVADTGAVGYSDCTGGSRVTFATGLAVTRAAEQLRAELCARAAAIWNVDQEQVRWQEGQAVLHDPTDRRLDIAELARRAHQTGGALTAAISLNATGAAPSCAVNLIDVDIDRETGQILVTRATVIQDAGTAVHPDYVEGQMQGGASQGIGWALNEEYLYDPAGKMLNPGFLDYRIPVASDLPMIDTVIIEVPNPDHPFGVRGVGETPICAPMAATANAVARALGTRITEMPMSPSRVRAAIRNTQDAGDA